MHRTMTGRYVNGSAPSASEPCAVRFSLMSATLNRHALVQEFIPNDDEQRLYALVSETANPPAFMLSQPASAS